MRATSVDAIDGDELSEAFNNTACSRCVYIYVCIYIYIYTHRERRTDRQTDRQDRHMLKREVI